MKKTISVAIIFLLIAYMIFAPAKAVGAAGNGLILWYETILPTLLPFAILANIFISSNCFYLLSDFLYPLIRLILPISREGTFPIFAGFLFGFPMGSRICSIMLKENKLSYDEASVIFAISNNMSPVFITSFILNRALGMPKLVVPTLLSLYLPAVIVGRILLHNFPPNACGGDFPQNIGKHSVRHKNTTPRFQLNFKIIDAAIMNGFDTLTKLGGYIMLFSIIASLIHDLPITSDFLKAAGIGMIEITNGIQYTADTNLTLKTKYLLMVAFTAFGGLSGLAQTASMVADSELPIKRYVIIKLILCVSSTLLAMLLFTLLP